MTIASYSKFHQDVVQGVEVQGGRNKVVSTKAPFGRLTHVRRGGVSHARSGGRSYRDVAQLTTFFAQQIFGLNSLNVSKHVALSSFNLPVRCVFCMQSMHGNHSLNIDKNCIGYQNAATSTTPIDHRTSTAHPTYLRPYLPLQSIIARQPHIPPIFALPHLPTLVRRSNNAPQIANHLPGPRRKHVRPAAHCVIHKLRHNRREIRARLEMAESKFGLGHAVHRERGRK
jgi:hypothetical protein